MQAILRSFGMRFGYYKGADWRQAMLIDPIIETWMDLMKEQAKIVFNLEVSDEEKRALMRTYAEGIVTKFHTLCETQLSELGGSSTFMAGESVTIVDFVMCSYAANTVHN